MRLRSTRDSPPLWHGFHNSVLLCIRFPTPNKGAGAGRRDGLSARVLLIFLLILELSVPVACEEDTMLAARVTTVEILASVLVAVGSRVQRRTGIRTIPGQVRPTLRAYSRGTGAMRTASTAYSCIGHPSGRPRSSRRLSPPLGSTLSPTRIACGKRVSSEQ